MSNKTEKLIREKDIDGLKELRRNGKLDYSCMTTLAIYKDMKMLNLIYRWSIEDDLKQVKVGSYTCKNEPMDKFMTDVLKYLVRDIEEPQHKEFLNLVRETKKLDYNALIHWVLHELSYNKLFPTLDSHIEYAEKDKFDLDFQGILHDALRSSIPSENSTANVSLVQQVSTANAAETHKAPELSTAEFLMIHARKANYNFNWQKMQEQNRYEDLRLLIKFAEEDKQVLTLNYVELLEGVNFFRVELPLLEFYIKRALDANQTIDWSKLVDLLHNRPQELAGIQKYIPASYKMPVFEEGFDIDFLANEHLLGDLGRYTMESTDFTHVIFEGQEYEVETDGCDECEMHDGDISDCNAPPEIYAKNSEDIDYQLKYEPYSSHFNSDQYDNANHDLIRRIQHGRAEKIKLMSPGGKVLVLHNTSGVNNDHRGFHHCKVDLEYHDSFSLQLPCTLIDFMKAIYKIKSHKRDHWYELYCGMKLKSSKNGIIRVDCSFDHGS